ncbi:MAG: acyl-CoA dehydrogenase family protein [Sulfobacillus sp.]
MDMINLELDGDGQRLLADFQEFRRTKVAPQALRHDREASFPIDVFADLHHAQLLELSVPREYGGRDVRLHNRFLLEVIAVEELSKACSATGQGYHNHNSAIEMITALGTEEQKKRFFGAVVKEGAVTGGWASERGGKTLLDLKTKATSVDGGYRINGEKFFYTNSGGARFGMLFIAPDGAPIDEFRLFIVPMDAPGVSRLNDWNPLGQRATTSGTTRYENVFVPTANVLGAPGEYFTKCPLVGHHFQIGWAAVYVGIAGGALEAGIAYVKSKSRPWFETKCERAVDDPYVQNHVADMSIGVEASRLMLYRAARLMEAASVDLSLRPQAATAVYQAKVMGTEVALEVSSRVFQVCGARAAADAPQSGLDIYWRNARTFTLHDPVDYRRQRIGKYLLGVEEPPVGWY